MSLSFLNVVSLAWYLLGIVETFRAEDCKERAPDTYKLSLALVIIFLVFLGYFSPLPWPGSTLLCPCPVSDSFAC